MSIKKKYWDWSWPKEPWVHVSHGYFPLSVALWLSILFPEALGKWAGHVVVAFKSVT